MKIKHLTFSFELKSLEKDGSFAGHSAAYTLDQGRDLIVPGAFEKTLASWKAKGKLPPVLWQHDAKQPIGPHTKMIEDDKGLYSEGQLLIDDVPKAREAHALMKAKAIDGQSIGYDVPPGGEEYDPKNNVRKLKQIDLYESSIVTFPMNVDASVTTIKAILDAGNVPTIREFESLLRDAGGYSRKQAEHIAKFGYADFQKQRDAGDGAIDEKSIERLANFISNLKVA